MQLDILQSNWFPDDYLHIVIQYSRYQSVAGCLKTWNALQDWW